jgi:hypothetical protein
VLTQSLQAVSPGARGWYVRGIDQAMIGPGNPAPEPGDGTDATWRIVPGKADTTCHSFESVARPEYYLRQLGLKVMVAPSDGTAQFKADATWCTKAGLNGTAALESFSLRGKLLRHHNGLVWAADRSGQNDFETPTGYPEDTSWQVDPPYPTTTAIAARWLNDEALRARVGDPTGDELVDGAVRWRDYQRGRLYWSQATGVHDLAGEILAVYMGLGAHTSFLGCPTSDEVDIPGGRRNSFEGGRIDLDTATGIATAYPG